jgi:phenylacetic acid degradation operon negative regulatory protein
MSETLDAIDAITAAFPLRAGAFIVTLYGDIVAPRGGQLWMGNIIETCAVVGISESRVRTAVSRLLAAGQIESERIGRKSYYRLTPAAQALFSSAARLIYRSPTPKSFRGWQIVVLPSGAERDTATARLAEERFGFPQPAMAIRPDRGEPLPAIDLPAFSATSQSDLGPLLADAWPLSGLSARIEDFLACFSPLAGIRLGGLEAISLRLLLVHVFRSIALHDPELPASLTPADWCGREARELFARLYLDLAGPADEAIARSFEDASGPLRPELTRISRRIADLSER